MNCSAIEFLELTKDILSRGASFRFQAKGWSMFPAIRHGDILNVEKVKLEDIRLGDVIFYRTRDRHMASHRVIKKIIQDDKTIFATKGDSNTGEDEEVYPEQILGRVKTIERNKKTIYINPGFYRLMSIFYAKFPSFFVTLRRIGGRQLSRIHGIKAYRDGAKKLIKLEISYHWEPCEGSGSGRWLLCRNSDIVIAKTTIDDLAETDYPYQGWWIFGTWVYWRYRGLGIGRRLTELACGFAAQNGGKEVKLLVFEDNKPALSLYKKFGFYQISIPEIDAGLREERAKTRRQRIVMKKDLL